MNVIRNQDQDNGGTAHLRHFGDTSRETDWDGLDTLRGSTVNMMVRGCWDWSGHEWGRLKRRFVEAVKEYMRVVGLQKGCRRYSLMEADDLLYQCLRYGWPALVLESHNPAYWTVLPDQDLGCQNYRVQGELENQHGCGSWGPRLTSPALQDAAKRQRWL